MLADEELDANAKHFADQAFRILDRDKTEVRLNGEWLAKLSFAEVVRLDAHAHRRAPARARRLREALRGAGADLALRAALPADAGLRLRRDRRRRRDRRHRPALQPAHGPRRDGALRQASRRSSSPTRSSSGSTASEKMSKSRGNYIGIPSRPRRCSARRCRSPTRRCPQWWELLAGGGEHPESPMEWKLELARRITARWHGAEGARAGEAHFTRVVRRHEAPGGDAGRGRSTRRTIRSSAGAARQASFGSSVEPLARGRSSRARVKVNGEPAAGYDVAARALDGARAPGGQAPFVRLRTAAIDRVPDLATIPRLPARAA